MENLKVKPTKKPHTFYLRYGDDVYTHYDDAEDYKSKVEIFVKEVNDFGLKANLKQKYVYTKYYITFRSRHDAMAFKLRWT